MAKDIIVDYDKYYGQAQSLGSNYSIFRRYIDFIKESNTPPNNGSKVNYLDLVIKFLKEADIRANEADESIIKSFLSNNAKTIAASVLKHFYGFVSEETGNLLFDFSIIQKPKNTPKPVKARGLALEKVFELREALKQNEYYPLIFSFEMVYCYNLSLDQLSECNYQSYDFETHSFIFGNKDVVLINEDIARILDQNRSDILEGRKSENEGKTRNAYQAQFNRMGKLLNPEILLSHDDIKATHELHSMKCPICQKTRLCESDYWCLVINTKEISQKKRLICKECADKLGLKEHE